MHPWCAWRATTRYCSPDCCGKCTTSHTYADSTTFSSVSTRAIRCSGWCAYIDTSHIRAGSTSGRGPPNRTETACMNGSIIVQPTSTSPLCDGGARLTGAAVASARVSRAERDEMYALLQTYFAGTDRGRFEADLCEK